MCPQCPVPAKRLYKNSEKMGKCKAFYKNNTKNFRSNTTFT